MRQILIVAAPAAAFCVLLAALLLVRSARRRAAAAARARPEPQSVVHVLTSDRELREAVERASRFERGVAEQLETRAARYESLLGAVGPPELRRVPSSSDPDGARRAEGAHQPRLA